MNLYDEVVNAGKDKMYSKHAVQCELYSKPVVQYNLYSENNVKDMGIKVAEDTAWENEMKEHEYLDNFIEHELEMLTDDAMVDHTVCNMMSSYLTNTNLISKRMMCATSSVETRTTESEL